MLRLHSATMKNAMLFITITILASTASAKLTKGEYVEGRLLAKFKAGITVIDGATMANTGIVALDSLNKAYRCSRLEPLLPRAKKDDYNNPLRRIYVFTFRTGEAIEKLIDAYTASGLFEYVEPDYITRGCSSGEGWFPNDEYFKRQWALHNDATFNMSGAFNPKDDADIDMPEAWEIEQGDTSVIIAILDSGCKMDHPELAGRLWKNPGEIPDNGVDDDGNGYIDDVNGWDFVNDDNDPSDDNGHGTAMAGIIGANTNNGIGFAGVNPNARMMILKVLDSISEGTTLNFTKGIEFATKKGAKIINMSLSHPKEVESEHEIIKFADSNNIPIVSGTGNDNVEKINYPAVYDEVFAVGATGPDDKRYSFSDTAGSNYGTQIDIVAPGVYIFKLDYKEVNKYNLYNKGTSLSTAYTTGVASLLLSKNPALTPSQIKDILRQSADDQVGDPSEDTKGWDKYFGWGRLNAHKALQMASAVRNSRYRPQVVMTRNVVTLTLTNMIKNLGASYYTLNGRIAPHTLNEERSAVTPGLYILRQKRDTGFPLSRE
ncbi:MAG: S8 family serine peptidase [Chitinispirillaceae bacterium]|nr:S8 family serine peptidase [Chitinispirillaceae bacterium]